ncbi:MAG: HEPN domain-containing protein [candidate division WOR-3 bacterium]|nr:HEPN domain-containing protein [candidate division WOR-3 bacterium]
MSVPKEELIRYRLERAREALDDAQSDMEQGRLNSASNRIYYAMFYATVALLTTKNLSSSRHSGVISLFYENFVQTGQFPAELARYLGRALEARIDTDYKVSVPPEPLKLTEMLENAETFVQKAEDLVRTA